MRDALVLSGALACSVAGMAWLALAMEAHWRQARGTQPRSRLAATSLRVLGSAGLGLSLLLCLSVDDPAMAIPVWVMTLGAAALAVAIALAWRPRTLAPLVAWLRS